MAGRKRRKRDIYHNYSQGSQHNICEQREKFYFLIQLSIKLLCNYMAALKKGNIKDNSQLFLSFPQRMFLYLLFAKIMHTKISLKTQTHIQCQPSFRITVLQYPRVGPTVLKKQAHKVIQYSLISSRICINDIRF